MSEYSTNSANLIRGDELNLYVQSGSTYMPIGYATECTLTISGDQIDCSNKSAGIWNSAISGKLSWEVSCGSLLAYENESGTTTSFGTMLEKMSSNEPFYVRIGQATSLGTATTDYNGELNTARQYFEGTAWMTSCELSANAGEVASLSITLTGDGKLTKTDGTAA